MNAAKVLVTRNVIVLLGLWTAAGIVGGMFALATNYLPHYIASSARPGSQVLLSVISGLPFLPAAFAAGYLVAKVISSARPVCWAIALSALLVVQHLSAHSFGWRWVRMDVETQIGIPLSAVLIGGSSFAGFWLGRQRKIGSHDVQPA